MTDGTAENTIIQATNWPNSSAATFSSISDQDMLLFGSSLVFVASNLTSEFSEDAIWTIDISEDPFDMKVSGEVGRGEDPIVEEGAAAPSEGAAASTFRPSTPSKPEILAISSSTDVHETFEPPEESSSTRKSFYDILSVVSGAGAIAFALGCYL